MKLFNVHAYRFGDRERHSYLVGIFSTGTKAKNAAKIEEAMRGGNKYKCEITEIELDNGADRSIFKNLPIPVTKTSCKSRIHFIAMSKPLGTPLHISLFKGLDSDSTVFRSLRNLVEQGILQRVTRGIYFLIEKKSSKS